MTRHSNNTALNLLLNNQNLELVGTPLSKTVTFVAATTGKQGDHTLLNVTGVVALNIFAVCETDLAGANATISVGTATTKAGLIALTTGTDIDAKEIWHDASPDASVERSSVILKSIVTENVTYTVATADLSAGALTFYVRWAPISEDGNVTVA